MRITKEQLKQIIKEELGNFLNESDLLAGDDPSYWNSALTLMMDSGMIPEPARIRNTQKGFLKKGSEGLEIVYGPDKESLEELIKILHDEGVKNYKTLRYVDKINRREIPEGVYYRPVQPNGVIIFNSKDHR